MRRSPLPPLSAEGGGISLPPATGDSHAGTLYIVSLPIGNPEDITLRALRVLGAVGLIVAEDARLFANLVASLSLTAQVVSLRPRHGRPALAAALARLAEGTDVALVADSGTPALVDPGLNLIRAAVRHGYRVTAVPGANACLAALILSGFAPSPFTFLGSPPDTPPERDAFFAHIATLSHTVVLYESRRTLGATLKALARRLGAGVRIVVARDLTQSTERIFRGSLSAAVAEFAGKRPSGAYTLVVSGEHEAILP